MQNFTFHNPTKIVFGKGSIAELPKLIPNTAKVLLVYGGGSIKTNGVYDQVAQAMKGRQMPEFGGIEPNPRYETCMKAVERVRAEGADFLLAVGGGSTIDATKFISAAVPYKGKDPWDMMTNWMRVPADPLPLGCVLTLPATGSESNGGTVVTRESTKDKLFFATPRTFPQFAILDPEATFSLPPRQVANGVVDAFAHVMEQYMTYPADAPLQDRQSEAILLTLIEEGPKNAGQSPGLHGPGEPDVVRNAGPQRPDLLRRAAGLDDAHDRPRTDGMYGIDHAQSLALVLPGVLHNQKQRKRVKLLQLADRVWGLRNGDEDARIDQAIDKTEQFFRSLGVGTRLSDYNIPHEAIEIISARIAKRRMKLGEHGDLGEKEVKEILELRE